MRVRPISAVAIVSGDSDYVTNVERKYSDLVFPLQFSDQQGDVIESSVHGEWTNVHCESM